VPDDVLTSTRNPRVRAAATLARRRERVERGQHLAEGPRAVAEALARGEVVEVFVTPGDGPSLTVPSGTRVTVVADHVLTAIADATSPQGIVAVVATPAVSARARRSSVIWSSSSTGSLTRGTWGPSSGPPTRPAPGASW
jgi:tRNA G18 (ribose-2'-O)-methylase SpoU